MSANRETNLALFIDFDNVALGARDARQRFDVKLLLQRLLEKGKVIVKKAYADWHFYKEYMSPLHEAAIELIEIPMPKISGKNSADIKLVVDAMDLCYSKDHIDTFVIVSGDSDFSPLVSKLRENDKRVIGVGVKNSSSKLLIGNCDEFIFYDDIYRQATDQGTKSAGHVPLEKRDLFDFLVATAQSLLQESRGVLYSSLIKDTMTRKKPDFNERAYGYSTFGDLLDEARKLGLLVVERDARAGGTWVVQGLGSGVGAQGQAPAAPAGEKPPVKNGGSRSGRRRRRSGDRPAGTSGASGASGASGGNAPVDPAQPISAHEGTPAGETGPTRSHDEVEYGRPTGRAAETGPAAPRPPRLGSTGPDSTPPQSPKQTAPTPASAGGQDGQQARKKTRRQRDGLRRSASPRPASQKPDVPKSEAQKPEAQKPAGQKAPVTKDAAGRTPAPKAPARRTTAKKAPAKKPAARKKVARKTEPKSGGGGEGGGM